MTTRPDRPILPMATVLAHAMPDLTDDDACRQTLYAAGFVARDIYIGLRAAQRGARIIRSQHADQLTEEANA
jgi:hypothetical protein